MFIVVLTCWQMCIDRGYSVILELDMIRHLLVPWFIISSTALIRKLINGRYFVYFWEFWSGSYFVVSRYFHEANSVADALANWVAVLKNSILPASIICLIRLDFFEVSNNQIR